MHCNTEHHNTSEQKDRTEGQTQLHTHTQPPSVTDELNDLTATGDAYLGSVTFMSEGMRPLIKASASVSLDAQCPCQLGRARAAMHKN